MEANKEYLLKEDVIKANEEFRKEFPYVVSVGERLLKLPTHTIDGNTSDGYHTFNELYHHRAVLFSVICNTYPYSMFAWKSKKHHDGTMYDGMFIVGINTPEGQVTYHYDIDPYWEQFNVQELEKAPEWDGHTPSDAINRISKLAEFADLMWFKDKKRGSENGKEET